MLTKHARALDLWTAAIRRTRWLRVLSWLCVGCLLVLVWRSGTDRFQTSHFGDDQEYLTMAMSFVRHGSPEFRPGDDTIMLAALPQRWRASLTNKFTPGGPPGAYFESRDGRYYAFHFFTYPAVVAPVRAVLDGRPDAFRAYQYTNLLMFSCALLSLLQLRTQPRLFWTLTPLTFLTPVLWFLPYAHTESFVFSLGVLALTCYLSGRRLLAIVFNSVAATQYQPLALISLCLCAQWLWSQRLASISSWPALRGKLPSLVAVVAATAVVFVPGIFYFIHFGVPNLIVREGYASVQLMSASKFGWMFVDPNGGMLAYAPGILLMLLAACVWALRRALTRRELSGLALLGCALATVFASTCQRNWNHPTFGVSRYVLYGLAPMLLVIGNEIRHLRRTGPAWAALVVIAVLLQVFTLRVSGFFHYEGPDSSQHSAFAQYVLARWPYLYSPPPEIFCERTRSATCHTDRDTGEPLPQYLPAIWQDERGIPRKILAQRCDEDSVLRARAWSAEQLATIHAAMQRCRGTGSIYIDP
jgi:hypothetical protein